MAKPGVAGTLTNGEKNGQVNGKPAGAPPPLAKRSKGRRVEREEIENTFAKYAEFSGDHFHMKKAVASTKLQEVKWMGWKGVRTLLAVVKSKASGKPTDDKEYLMERIIQLVANLPAESSARMQLTQTFVKSLWVSLPHPPLTYLGDEYRYRAADGSNNNPMFPRLGAANTPYARSIRPITIQPAALPDPGLIFDSLFARQEFKPHPNGVSSIFFSWASLIIHDLFQTDPRNQHISKTSSYLDLSTLYGDNQDEQDQIRTFEGGKLKVDSFSDARLIALPPACSVILVMLNRFHNYVVEQLALINENGRFTKPPDYLSPEQSAKAWAKYDNDLFQTGRLITCGLYMNITLYDYVRTIINLTRSNTTWSLDPRIDTKKTAAPESAESGVGNQVSFEFNLAYRWHSCIGQLDEKWIDEIYQDFFGKSAEQISMPELMAGMSKWQQLLPGDPSERTFAKLERQADGRFRDEDLARIMTEATEEVAGTFGPRNVPKALRAVEILGIQQARKFGCGSLNEFRKFFGLKEYETFEEINSDPEIAGQLRNLYEHPDYVELYPGIVSEEPKIPMVPGAGICPTYTISRAVLSDAVALVRGDRFYTSDYNAKNLTNWGYAETHYDLSINEGCMFYKLMLRALPNYLKPDSIYAHYPMTVPSVNKEIFTKLGRESHYSWDRPALQPPRIDLTSYNGARAILQNAKDFRVTWEGAFGSLPGSKSFNETQTKAMDEVFAQDSWRETVKTFYKDITQELLKQNSVKIAGINQIDITRDLGNLAHVHFAASTFDLSIKTKDNPEGIFTDHEMFMVMVALFTSVFSDIDPTKTYPLRQVAREVGEKLGQIVESYVKSVKRPKPFSGIADKFQKGGNTLAKYGADATRKLLKSGLGVSQVALSHILPIICTSVPSQAQAFTQILGYYLSNEGKVHLSDINRLAKEDSLESDTKLLHFCMEGLRLSGTFGSFREANANVLINDGGREVSINDGDKVFVSMISSARDPNIFPTPDKVVLDRPLESYIHYTDGAFTCFGRDAQMVALASMLRVVGRLDNLRPAPGAQGQLVKVSRPGGHFAYMRQDYGGYSVLPTTLKVHYDSELK
ncbi:prostaglandin-endoperoxide synthase 1 [Blastomyces gilchristii SLH14081]|uniref:Prostaglandin-endoperoxide synthase 1 n=1 Tax=Blastomyces gilchristii (strain SLH14081) TaxID=559298 RepID=A0A179UUB6_BLAGS|nr:prostaglandin-endoperoxide synthase 1 [Blastomyces gilchristii SLH14081]OAT10748.1 prostaglandin-endoperoxide synthase 1 [Blastomyces gilchristii SLH14081]